MFNNFLILIKMMFWRVESLFIKIEAIEENIFKHSKFCSFSTNTFITQNSKTFSRNPLIAKLIPHSTSSLKIIHISIRITQKYQWRKWFYSLVVGFKQEKNGEIFGCDKMKKLNSFCKLNESIWCYFLKTKLVMNRFCIIQPPF